MEQPALFIGYQNENQEDKKRIVKTSHEQIHIGQPQAWCSMSHCRQWSQTKGGFSNNFLRISGNLGNRSGFRCFLARDVIKDDGSRQRIDQTTIRHPRFWWRFVNCSIWRTDCDDHWWSGDESKNDFYAKSIDGLHRKSAPEHVINGIQYFWKYSKLSRIIAILK